jgi:hypothetical protein
MTSPLVQAPDPTAIDHSFDVNAAPGLSGTERHTNEPATTAPAMPSTIIVILIIARAP